MVDILRVRASVENSARGLRFRVQGSGAGVWKLEFMFKGLRFRF
jgi:hypothetical protein